jgi:hypothetical protein
MVDSWKTEKRFTSYLNREPEALAGSNFASRIEYRDVSQRDGEQQTGLVFRVDEKRPAHRCRLSQSRAKVLSTRG